MPKNRFPDLRWTEWFSVTQKKPPCSRDLNALGTEVLIWPRDDGEIGATVFYGRRATGKPEFYKYGAIIHSITHWAHLPGGP